MPWNTKANKVKRESIWEKNIDSLETEKQEIIQA